MARQLAKHTNSRMDQCKYCLYIEIQGIKWKGCSAEISSFASGIIMQCPKIS